MSPASSALAAERGPKQTFSSLTLRKRDARRIDSGEIAFRAIPGRLFTVGPSYADARQGNIGDCYLLCAFSAVARAAPDWIRAMIAAAPGEAYDVRFFKIPESGAPQPQTVRVDAAVPVTARDGLPLYARVASDQRGERQIWPLIAEKAYAAWKGGYDVIGEGGAVEETLEEITGEPSHVFYVAKTNPEYLWDVLRRATTENWPAAACSYGRVAKPELDEFGFHPWHIHIFLGVHTWNGRRIVWLRDPFDRPQAGTVNLPDPNGVFTLGWEHFLNYFAEVIVNHAAVRDLAPPAHPVVTIRQALERSYVFQPLPPDAKALLAADFRRVRIAEGQTVFTCGASADHYYLIRSGSASVHVAAPGGRLRQVAVLEAGDQFGEMALINDSHRSAEIRAITPLALYRLSGKAFRSWLVRFPELDERFRQRFAFQQWMERWSKRAITSVSLDALLASGREQTHAAGDLILREGDPAESFYLVMEGTVEAFAEAGGRKLSLGTQGPGELFGEMAALRGAHRRASTQAACPCRLLRIDINTAANVVEDFGALQRQLEFIARQRQRRRGRRR